MLGEVTAGREGSAAIRDLDTHYGRPLSGREIFDFMLSMELLLLSWSLWSKRVADCNMFYACICGNKVNTKSLCIDSQEQK